MAKGRQPNTRGEAYWRRVVRQQAASGVTIREFCRQSKLRESSFYFWRKELLRRESAQPQQGDHTRPPTTAAFVPAGGRRVHVAPPVDRL